jgi:putative ABC transport system permease protein
MRFGLVMSLAWQDYRADARLSACAVLALVAVIAPLLVLFGLKFGLVSSLTERLERDPLVREIIPLGGGRFNAAFINELAQRPDVAFAIPRTRQIAATADLSVQAPQEAQQQAARVNVEMIPTAIQDPLLGAMTVPAGLDQIILSQTAAHKLGVKPGDWLDAAFTRQIAGQAEAQHTRVQVSGVLPLQAFPRDALFAPLALLEAAEDYRDGRAVPALGWAGDRARAGEQRVYPAFRLYAQTLNDVEPLRRYFADSDLLVSTQAAAIAQVQSLSRNLNIVFWIIAGLAVLGAFAAIAAGALAAVERKRHELSVLRLLGLSTGALLSFVMCQALYSGLIAAALGGVLYGLAERGLNLLFMQEPGEYASQLLLRHYLVALAALLGASALAAALGGWRVAHIEPAEGIRDV